MYDYTGLDQTKLWTTYYSLAASGASLSSLGDVQMRMNEMKMKHRMLRKMNSIESCSSSDDDLFYCIAKKRANQDDKNVKGYSWENEPNHEYKTKIYLEHIENPLGTNKDAHNDKGGKKRGIIRSIIGVFPFCGHRGLKKHA